MNRYSMIFALLVASSFAVHPTEMGNGAAGSAEARKPVVSRTKQPDEPTAFLERFLKKAAKGSNLPQNLQILFATVPHPVETHLASAFDQDVDALRDGLQESGYLFDSSWIPWNPHTPRELFDDDEKEKKAKEIEDGTPGILLFRQNQSSKESNVDLYANGVVVFLLSEKPTEGIAVPQAGQAWTILQKALMDVMNVQKNFEIPGPIRILGPSYSGSFASLVSLVNILQEKIHAEKIKIRSGGVTGGQDAEIAMREIAKQVAPAQIDFGSAQHENEDWIIASVRALKRLGIGEPCIATLSEDESSYGRSMVDVSVKNEDTQQPECDEKKDAPGAVDVGSLWSLAYPRDISSLRAGYAQQGILDVTSPAQPWKRSLVLKADDQNEGDTIRSFGGPETIASQESILLGISEFVKEHGIRALIVSGSNEQDLYFLTQFFHAHNSRVRIVVVGNTRLFLRGSTAQFRGDMMVSSFPTMPLLHDWTATEDDRAAPIFADDVSQGIYFAALDLFNKTSDSFPEYSEPTWNPNGTRVLRPPIYVVALGSDATWPVAEERGTWFVRPDPTSSPAGAEHFRVEMPFTYAGDTEGTKPQPRPAAKQISVGLAWEFLLLTLVVWTVTYCGLFWYADPVTKIAFASYAPSAHWRFWLFKVATPAAVAGFAFVILAKAVEMPLKVSCGAVLGWHFAECMTFFAPLAIASSAMAKARVSSKLERNIWMIIPFLVPFAAAVRLFFSGLFSLDPFALRDIGSILNSYREMHWESELSLVPTWMLLLLAVRVWATQAGSGTAALEAAPMLPSFPGNPRISRKRGLLIVSIARPTPDIRHAVWLWATWLAVAASFAIGHFFFSPFFEITSLERHPATRLILLASAAVAVLTLVDLIHFVWLWQALQGLLRALDREQFKRSFVPIEGFKWKNLWSFTGASFEDRRAIAAAGAECVFELAIKHKDPRFSREAEGFRELRTKYSTFPLPPVGPEEFEGDQRRFFHLISIAASKAASTVAAQRFAPPVSQISPDTEAIQRSLVCQCRAGEGGRFSDESEALARLPESQQMAERLLCLLYIGFIQAVVARLHSLLVSVSLMFSFVTLGMTIYPFVPFSPLMFVGIVIMLAIGLAFFKVFSEMDTDPILSRIVNGDDRKLQGNFYMKFAEALALPLLALGSSVLPGGAGRLLSIVQTVLNHAQ
jgi:hypothetical protein